MSASIIQSLLKGCTNYKGRKVYVESIPEKVETRARQKFKLPSEEMIVAYFDFTPLSYGRKGMIIAATGLYVRDAFIPWDEFIRLRTISTDEYYIYLKEDLNLLAYSSPLPRKTIVSLLLNLQQILTEASSSEGAMQLMPSDDVSLKEAVVHTLQYYKKDRVYIGEIPESVQANIRSNKRFAMLKGLEIWAFFDFSLSGKAKEGVAFAEDGIHWRLAGFGHIAIPWHVLKHADITFQPRGNSITVNEIKQLFAANSMLSRENWIRIMTSLQSLSQMNDIQSPIEQIKPNTNVELDSAFFEVMIRANDYFDKKKDYGLNARQYAYIDYSFQIPDSEQVIAYKSTASGSFDAEEYGCMLTNSFIYIRNSPGSDAASKLLLPFTELADKKLGLDGKRLLLDDIEVYNESNSTLLFELLCDIQLYMQSFHTKNNPSVYPYDPYYMEQWSLPVQRSGAKRWLVVQDGMLRGIFDEAEIRWAVETGQLKHEITKIWKYGMAEWISVDEANMFNNDLAMRGEQ